MITNLTGTKLREIMDEYDKYDEMNVDDEELMLHQVLLTGITEPERIIMYLYAEYASQRELAETLNVSRSIVRKEITRIKQKIKDALDRETNPDSTDDGTGD